MIKNIQDITKFAPCVKGVFTITDIKAALNIKHTNSFYLRLKALEKEKILIRFIQGIYVTQDFDPAILSQTLCSESYISFEYVLAKHLIIGTIPGQMIRAVKVGKKRKYTSTNLKIHIEHFGIKNELFTGYETIEGMKIATPEKAVLDTLYFYLRGESFLFDIYSDMDLSGINKKRLFEYLKKYNNSKFVTFVENLIHDYAVS